VVREPIRLDPLPPLIVGIASWLIALGIALARRGELSAVGRGWWVTVCLLGLALGLAAVGAVVVLRRRQRSSGS
jgi:hypothetical protein